MKGACLIVKRSSTIPLRFYIYWSHDQEPDKAFEKSPLLQPLLLIKCIYVVDLDSPSEMIRNLWLISMYRYKEIIILDDFFFCAT